MSIGPWDRILETLDTNARPAARRLRRGDDDALAVASAAGVHGVYVENALAADQVDGLVFTLDDAPCGVAWFGPRGNLVLVSDERLDEHAAVVAEQVLRGRWSWRIALGRAALVDAIASRAGRASLAHRDQVYYVAEPSDVPPRACREDVRGAVAADRDRLARATLALNASDLNIAPERVDRRWLYRMIGERTKDGSTRVLGPPGGLWCKLDHGSAGPGGLVLEGVFSFPDVRGRGLATALVGSCIKASACRASLHVAADNVPARRCYERAGMREAGACRLLLLG